MTTIWLSLRAVIAGVAAMIYLALVLWSVGEVDRALRLVERMRERLGTYPREYARARHNARVNV